MDYNILVLFTFDGLQKGDESYMIEESIFNKENTILFNENAKMYRFMKGWIEYAIGILEIIANNFGAVELKLYREKGLSVAFKNDCTRNVL